MSIPFVSVGEQSCRFFLKDERSVRVALECSVITILSDERSEGWIT